MQNLVVCLLVPLTALLAGQETGYLDPAVCAACHRGIYDTYRRTGMGRSFYRYGPENAVEDYARNNTYYHGPSDRYYTMYRRGDRYYQRRHQIGPGGGQIHVVEKEIHFVLGSGNHSRTYLHRTPRGQLVELPIAWYAEKGGSWAMNPGYDRPDHLDFRRKLDQECFFCHNAYPQIESVSDPGRRDLFLRGAIPEGIDCQRCHGPGRRHVEAAQAGGPLDAVRKAVVNPARLSTERQLELCLQCHLESTSFRLPYSLRRYGRGYFSYRPGEPLQDYILHFDHAAGTGYDGKFEISHAAYRLLKSACFRASSGALTCTTCHNPHDAPRGDRAVQRYVQACRGCHAGAHNASQDCLECHMPQRRTEDVVHVVMTDHYIQRHKPAGDLLAPLAERHDADRTAYRGEVALLYPPRLPATPETELYLAAAQVADSANFPAGIPRLEKALRAYRPPQPEFYFELANAYSKTNQSAKALPYYEEALRRKPGFLAAQRNYAAALSKLGRLDAAARVLETAVARAPEDAAALNALGAAYLHLGRLDQAVTTLGRALGADPDLPEIYVNLGTALAQKGDPAAAIDALENALRVGPEFAAAHNNLGSILHGRGDFPRAQYHFEKAIGIDPNYAAAHYNYGRALSQEGLLEKAEAELRAAWKLDPQSAETATSLGLVLAQKGQLDAAIEHYRRAIRIKPDLTAAHFNLGLALLRQEKPAEAKRHFQTVLRLDPNDDQARVHLQKASEAQEKKR